MRDLTNKHLSELARDIELAAGVMEHNYESLSEEEAFRQEMMLNSMREVAAELRRRGEGV